MTQIAILHTEQITIFRFLYKDCKYIYVDCPTLQHNMFTMSEVQTIKNLGAHNKFDLI